MNLMDSIVTTVVGAGTLIGGGAVVLAGFLTGIGAPAGAMVGIPMLTGSIPVLTSGIAGIIDNVTQDTQPQTNQP
ncbi:MAG: hypothetical protein FD153_6 [Rhodospirillaceae bacterium]|nr:MAG: hypothetical protein FD153_6 [Rhodospirillaceae bacterium]